MQFCPVGAEMFHADRWTDRDMIIRVTVVQMFLKISFRLVRLKVLSNLEEQKCVVC
jgi:hypothetical protein